MRKLVKNLVITSLLCTSSIAYADNMWLFVPVQQKVKEFLGTIPGYPFQPGSSLSAAGIDYKFLAEQQLKAKIEQLEKAARR